MANDLNILRRRDSDENDECVPQISIMSITNEEKNHFYSNNILNYFQKKVWENVKLTVLQTIIF